MSNTWKIIIADDVEQVHRVIKLAMSGFDTIEGRPIEWLDAYTGQECLELLKKHEDVSLILLDVVMESDRAGLNVVQTIRNKLKNDRIRIAICTGEPGGLSATDVYKNYDIDEYKQKTQLTVEVLFSLICRNLAQYQMMLEYDSLKGEVESGKETSKESNEEVTKENGQSQ